MFHDIFSDPDGDELTYTASVPPDQSQLVDDLQIRLARTLSNGEKADILFFIADAEDDWKAISPTLPDRPVITVTLTATDPGGLSASVSGDFVIRWESYPEVVSARAEGAAIALTFDWAVEANPAPAPEQFTVHVVNEDGSAGTVEVNSVSVSEQVMTLELASELDESQTVTLDYAYNYHDDTPLQRAGGGDAAPGFTGQAVTFLQPPGEPQNLAVSAEAGSLDIAATWDALDGATSYKLRWRQSGGEFDAANTTTVTDASATITVSDYGEWEVRLQGCNDAGCGPEFSYSMDTVVAAVQLSLEPARDAEGNIRPRTITASWDPVPGAVSYMLRWWRAEPDAPAFGRSDITRQRRAGGGPSDDSGPGTNQLTTPADQTSADFTVPDDARYQADLQARGNNGGIIAQGVDEVNQTDDHTDTTPPRLVRGEIDGDTITLYFSEALDEDSVGGHFRVDLYSVSAWTDFTAEPREVKISGNKVVVAGLRGSGAPWKRIGTAEGDRAEVYYYYINSPSPAAKRLRDLAGNVVWTPYVLKTDPTPFSSYRQQARSNVRTQGQSQNGVGARTGTIELNNITEPPSLESATAHPHSLTLTFDETLDRNSAPEASAFTVTVNGSEVSLANVEPVIVSGDTVTLALDSPLASTDNVTVSYAKPSRNRLRGVDGDAKNFSGRSVTNLVGVVPSVSEVAISSTPAVDSTYAPGETISVRLTFTAPVTVDTTGGTPRLKIRMGPSHGEQWADYAGGSGTTTLTFDYTVVERNFSSAGVAVLRDGLNLNGGSIRSATNQKDAHLRYAGLDHDPNHQADWRRSGPGVPWVTGVNISSNPGDDFTYALGDALRVTVAFSETVNVDMAGGTPRLKIKMDPSYGEKWADYADGAGASELTFDYTVVEPNRSPKGFAVLGNTLELNGGAIRSMTTPPVNAHLRYAGLDHDADHLVDGVRPSLQDMSVNASGTVLAMTFTEPLDEDSVPPASAFTVKRTPQGGTEETMSLNGSPVIAAGVVFLTLDEPVLDTDAGVTVSYDQPAQGASDRLRDQAGNEAVSFSEDLAEADTTPPRLVRGEIDGDVITLFFSEALHENKGGQGDHYRISLQWKSLFGDAPHHGRCRSDGQWYTFYVNPREVRVSGNTVVVDGLSKGYPKYRAGVGQNINNFKYVADVTTPASQRLRDLSGNHVHTPDRDHSRYWESQTILLPSVTRLPFPEIATVDGNRLILTFSAPMDGGSKPAASTFTVKVNGSAVGLAGANPVVISGKAVTLTLASNVAQGASVMVSYDKPSVHPLQNVICEDAPSFSDMSVTVGPE